MGQTHTQVKKLNLLDHINFFPSKEEGRIPGGRKVLSERKTKPVGVQGKSLVPTSVREKRVIDPPRLRNKERCCDANFTSQDSWSSVAAVKCVQMCKQNSNKEGIANCGHFQLPFSEVVHGEVLDVFCLRRQTHINPRSEVILLNI